MTVDKVGSQRFPDTSQPQMGTWGKRLTECSEARSEILEVQAYFGGFSMCLECVIIDFSIVLFVFWGPPDCAFRTLILDVRCLVPMSAMSTHHAGH
jgi:hypothetical protein